ncbi:tRNA (N(6)-L-threonylcarbamoyladenosine(37)-C(2))-methylthiotransferase MtaB [Candidatus Nitrospira bockiana]
MRATLCTLGCRLNQAESAALADRLKGQGYELVEYGEPTDLLVVNTCSVTENAERECRYEIRRTLKHSPHAFVAVTGCYAQTGAQALRRIPGIDLIVGAQFKMRLPDYLPTPHALRKQPAPEVLHTRTIDRDDFVMPGVGEHPTTRATLKIQDGCSFMCSFCLIPFARGHERSRAFDDAVREAEALAALGHRELILTGVNIGRYRQQGRDLLDLLRRLEAIPGVDRLRISSIEPTTISLDLLDHLAASKKICRHLHIPLQSGDDRILEAMNRRYTAADYRTLIEAAMARMPDLALGGDVMVGFPGEDERAFANTVAFVQDLPFAYFHVFSFSRRPGTAAARLTAAVPDRVIRRRSRHLAEAARAKRFAFYERWAGSTATVLFESRDETGRWTGLTEQYVRVAVSAGEDLHNQLEPVMITGVMDGLAVGHLV